MHALGLPSTAPCFIVGAVNRVFLALGAAVLAGCATVPPPPPAPSEAPAVSSAEAFVPLDKVAADSLAVAAVESHALPDGRLEVLISLKNRTAVPVRAGVACFFKNAQGAPTGEAAVWRPLALAGDAVETLRFESADARAERFTIAARGAR